MTRRRRAGATAFYRALVISFLAIFAASQSAPDHAISSSNNLPARLFISEETESVILHDSSPTSFVVQPAEGEVIHQTFEFNSYIAQYAYFNDSQTILVQLNNHTIWQSNDEGYSWRQLYPETAFLVFYHHKYSNDRAYLVTNTPTFYYTTDAGRTWHIGRAPTPPITFGAQVLSFHPVSDNLIWVGNRDCPGPNCRAEAQYSRDNGHSWNYIEGYVRRCAFAMDTHISADPTEIICESYKEKEGSQRLFGLKNPLELVVGSNFYSRKSKLFDSVTGFGKFSEFLVVAEIVQAKRSLELQVSLDGKHFTLSQFPPSVHPGTHAFNILESSTKSLFLHMTTSESPALFWGPILKSNSNGTHFGISIENVNRDDRGYVDFEKTVGLDGIALTNIVSNPQEAMISGRKKLQSRITRNDGSTWSPLEPPLIDSEGREYACKGTKCQLHVHGFTGRYNPWATFSSPSVPGLIMAVGNVGETLAGYTESDTFLSRDGGFTWLEVHKGAHIWKFGDSGSILVMANNEEPTDFILFSTDEGLHWREYKFSDERMRVWSIATVPMANSRRFILMGQYLGRRGSVVVHIDFTALTSRQCVINVEDPGHDDFELWSPSGEQAEQCLFGRRTLYHRRVRTAECVVGNKPKAADVIIEHCPCTTVDFECEFNHVKNSNGECVLVPGTTPVPDGDSCRNGESFWYERTPYRVIPYSSCVDGYRLDRGKEHLCPRIGSKGGWFWMFMILIPFAFTALLGYYYYCQSGLAKGTIYLPEDGDDMGVVATLACIPGLIIGVVYEWVTSHVDTHVFNPRRGYADLPIDQDAQIFHIKDKE